MRIFKSPDEFLDWVAQQSQELRLEIAESVSELMCEGYEAYDAAHITYARVTRDNPNPDTVN